MVNYIEYQFNLLLLLNFLKNSADLVSVMVMCHFFSPLQSISPDEHVISKWYVT